MKERFAKLFGMMEQIDGSATVQEIPVDKIRANPFQPRREFREEELQELAKSIQTYGLLQPIVVRSRSNSWYELIAGERRLRAVRLLGLSTIPALVRDFPDEDVALLALLENLQRQDLSFWEEAEGYARLLTEFDLTQEELARRLGKSQSTIANKLRLLRLPDSIRHNISREIFTERHARALLKLPDAETQEKIAKKVVAENLTVQATEQLVEKLVGGDKAPPKKPRWVRVYKDIRLFLNTIRQAVAELKKAGLKATITEQETEDCWEINIVVLKKEQDKPKAKGRKVALPVDTSNVLYAGHPHAPRRPLE
ncbi:MAG: nucleoid occlusion protein [Firmicutes bacterium]|jgi:ParB family chromosome partitioning protein|nr:nucleoid occlusion protein [Bacillota bacterium]